MTTAVSNARVDAPAGPGRARALTVAATVLAVIVVWLIAVPLLGVSLRVQMTGRDPMAVTLALIVAVTVAASLAGWALLALLGRHLARAGAVWLGVAVAVLGASYTVPLSSQAATSTTVVLLLLHTTVAAVLVPGLARTVSTARRMPAS